MEIQHILLIIGLFLLILVIKFLERKKKKYIEGLLPYTKKDYFLTRAEHEFFKVLELAVADTYYIFPQVHYEKILLLSGEGSRRRGYLSKIDKKSADFVLFDKRNVSPILVIELDDRTHLYERRIRRDIFINNVLEKAKIPILHVNTIPDSQKLREQIEEKLTP